MISHEDRPLPLVGRAKVGAVPAKPSKQEKFFFSEEKKQKTFIPSPVPISAHARP
jgi:hypothetical protein